MEPPAPPILDIWLRSPLTLSALVDAPGLRECEFDTENYWEWAIGWIDGVRLNVTRTHTAPPASVDTRIFCNDIGPFPTTLKDAIVDRLLRADCDPVLCGRWVYRSGDDFDLQEVERFTLR
jgi:hypothetical protein